jgi:YVTN family beta-propeller protein
MRFLNTRNVCLGLLVAAGAAVTAQQTALFPRLKSAVGPWKQEGGFYLLPTNQLLRPWGEQTLIPGRPVDMTYDSMRRVLAVLNTRAIWLLDGTTGAVLKQVPTKSTSYAGIAFRPGDRELWASETARNGPDSIFIAELSDVGMPGKTARIELSGHPLPVGIAFSPDGKIAYVAFSRSNAIAVIDTMTREIVKQIDVGMAPFGVAVSKDGKKVFVSNRGGRRPEGNETTATSSGSQVVTDPVTGSSASGTLSVMDTQTFAVKNVAIGLSPSHLTLSADGKLLSVSNGHSDSVSLIDTATLARTDVKIPTYPQAAIGSQPISSAFAADGQTLYVACAGNNAVAIVNRAGGKWSISGAVPTGWFPTALALSRDGSLRVLNIKGTGNTTGKDGTFNSHNYEGSLNTMPAPAAAQIAAGTREVRAANSPVLESAGGVANLWSLGIEHVFFIVKENRTYDQVFGDVKKGNGDPKLCMYCGDITPNHHALAEQYVLLDNFYTGGAISFDGHQWLMQTFVSDYVERAFAASPRGYAWDMSDALVVPPTGFFWQSARKPVDVRIYGEFQLPDRGDVKANATDINENRGRMTWTDYWKLYKEGKWEQVARAKSGVPAMQPYSCRTYPDDSTTIPDAIRVEAYRKELAQIEKSGHMPQLSILTLSNDHTNGTNPTSPVPRAMVAANDLALGQIVEMISKTRFWAKSLILVVEDDAQNGTDHVDGHRTVALAIGPHIRRGVVDSNNYNHLSMVRTIQDIFRIPPQTRYAVAARPMTSLFTATPDLKGYTHIDAKMKLDEMNPPLKALAGRQLWAARESSHMDWDEPDDAPEDVLNRILWWEAKGWDAPYPDTARKGPATKQIDRD